MGEALSKMGNNDVSLFNLVESAHAPDTFAQSTLRCLMPQKVIVRRGEAIPKDMDGPIVICTRNDDLQGVLDATPSERQQGKLTR